MDWAYRPLLTCRLNAPTIPTCILFSFAQLTGVGVHYGPRDCSGYSSDCYATHSGCRKTTEQERMTAVVAPFHRR